MSETKTKATHTPKLPPAPWIAIRESDDGDLEEWRVQTNPGGKTLVRIDVYTPVASEISREETARLIAAAPDLLAACKRALAIFKAQGESVRSGAVTGALADAIQKATGAP